MKRREDYGPADLFVIYFGYVSAALMLLGLVYWLVSG